MHRSRPASSRLSSQPPTSRKRILPGADPLAHARTMQSCVAWPRMPLVRWCGRCRVGALMSAGTQTAASSIHRLHSQTLKPSERRHALCASILSAHASSPLWIMHSSLTFLVSGQAQQMRHVGFLGVGSVLVSVSAVVGCASMFKRTCFSRMGSRRVPGCPGALQSLAIAGVPSTTARLARAEPTGKGAARSPRRQRTPKEGGQEARDPTSLFYQFPRSG